MRYVNIVLCVLMILSAAFHFNDADPVFWMAIYLIVAAWTGLAAFRPDILRTDLALTGLSLCLLGSIGFMITLWPADDGWWRQEVWLESETAREGIALIVIFFALIVVLFTGLRARQTEDVPL